MPITMKPCLQGSWSFHTDGSGMQRMMISVAMLMPDEKYQMGSVSRQMLIVLGAMTLMGRHARLSKVACTHAQRQTMMMDQKQMRCMSLSRKMRRYWKRKPSLTTFMAML
jgi:hypothetical protein